MSPIQTLPAITRGDYEEIEFVAEDPDGVPLDLTGRTIRLSAKRDLDSPMPVIQKSSENIGDVEIIDAAGGEGKVILTGEEPEVLAMKADAILICDMEITDSQGRRATTRFRLPVEIDVTEARLT